MFDIVLHKNMKQAPTTNRYLPLQYRELIPENRKRDNVIISFNFKDRTPSGDHGNERSSSSASRGIRHGDNSKTCRRNIMAVLIRRIVGDVQAKLRKMVEEHSTNIKTQIESEYSPSNAVHVAANLKNRDSILGGDSDFNTKPLDSDIQTLTTTSSVTTTNLVTTTATSMMISGEKTNIDDVDGNTSKQENAKKGFKSSKPASIDSKRSKSLCNTSSVDSAEDSKTKKESNGAGSGSGSVTKQPQSNPTKCDNQNDNNETKKSDEKEIKTMNNLEEQSSPTDNLIGTDFLNLTKPESPKAGSSTQQDHVVTDSPSPRSPRSSDGTKDELSILALPSSSSSTRTNAAVRRLRMENEKLQAEVTRLRRLVVSGALSLLNEKKAAAAEGNVESPVKMQTLQIELQLTKEALLTLKSDRRRLKAEKFELLNQMKQLYDTLEDKEKELRDFIRNYEQLSTEREERERERWSLLRHARDEAERSLALAAQLNAKELQLQHAQEQLQDARRQLASSGCLSDQESVTSMPRHSLNGGAVTPGSGGFPATTHGLGLMPGDRGSCSADSGVRVSSDRESAATSIGGNLSDSTIDGTPTITIEGNNVDVDSISIVSSIPPPHMYQSISTKDCSPTLSPSIASSFSKSMGSTILSRSVEQLSSPLDPEPVNLGRRSKNSHNRPGGGRGGTWGSISRVFARSRNRNKTNSLQDNSESNLDAYRNWSPLTEEGYAEKLRLLREASSIPMERWRAPTVVAWLEVALGMPQYSARCTENIKSGKVLLELSDFELECGLGITHPMHRKKLRLAIEEHRHPELIRYSCIAQLGHTWVSSEWLPDLGLSQYSDTFAANLVDARMLEHLSKKELEKYLGVTRKFHQASVVHGIHLLRIMKYDRQALAVRRHQCENMDTDPLVWTNQRFIRWARNIDLGEYADNLKDSGVHGGLVVLEPSFNGDTMATALGIPTSKNIIRRHLTAELEALILPARYVIFCQMEEFQLEAARVVTKHHKDAVRRDNVYRYVCGISKRRVSGGRDG
ncbi:SAM domain (Sterile alpha motif) [Popillia japonica]|uniref:SAM domain (Sterile alpha motif) n=1 Tax=Popillia japonica TaxID=7064 RepID=A0AAW1KFF6_POPJA